jgi:hypothetical protein
MLDNLFAIGYSFSYAKLFPNWGTTFNSLFKTSSKWPHNLNSKFENPDLGLGVHDIFD